MGDTKRWVIHRGTGIVDVIKREWSGKEGDRYVDREGGVHTARVVELEGGHTFLDRDGDAFDAMTWEEVGFLMGTRHALAILLTELKKQAHNCNVESRAATIIVSEFRTIASAIEKGVR